MQCPGAEFPKCTPSGMLNTSDRLFPHLSDFGKFPPTEVFFRRLECQVLYLVTKVNSLEVLSGLADHPFATMPGARTVGQFPPTVLE